MISKAVWTLIAGITALTVALIPKNTLLSPYKQTADRTRRWFAALEQKDLATLDAMLDQSANLTIATSFSGDLGPATHVVGKPQVHEYLSDAFVLFGTIDYLDERMTIAVDGKTAFLEANGNFTGADGRLYQSVYVERLDFNDGGLITRFVEYINPVAFCRAFADYPGCPTFC